MERIFHPITVTHEFDSETVRELLNGELVTMALTRSQKAKLKKIAEYREKEEDREQAKFWAEILERARKDKRERLRQKKNKKIQKEIKNEIKEEYVE